uniref:Uncharacterized protein n=1 Tax=Plectus sambesii TaxID=2011161 RepID=A0A914XEL6_9BILA
MATARAPELVGILAVFNKTVEESLNSIKSSWAEDLKKISLCLEASKIAIKKLHNQQAYEELVETTYALRKFTAVLQCIIGHIEQEVKKSTAENTNIIKMLGGTEEAEATRSAGGLYDYILKAANE